MIASTEPGGKTSVFISHSSQDSVFTARLATDLTERGFQARTFKDVLPPSAKLGTDRLHSALVEALENDSYVLAILSPDFVKSRWVTMEVGTAIRAEERKGEVGLLPVLARNCERPEILGLRTPTDFTESYDVGLEDLLARLSAPKRTAPVDQDNHAVLVASEAAATTLQHSLTEIRERLSLLSPQQFEELVAEQFRKHFDLEVTLTSKTRDGGVDIIALGGKDGRDHPILIQCKRYSPRKQVGVEVVRSLFGTMALHGVNRGIVVTTSHFTKQATDEARRVREMCRDRWTLDLIDSDALVNWLAHSPALGPNVTTPLTQLRLRYVNLVDKKYTGGLSPEEEAERGRLATALEEADAALYEPLKEALVRERDRLLKAKEDHGRES